MKHLSNERLVDLAEGGTSGLDHLERCAVCRDRVSAVRRTMDLLREDPIPEPSPLFWEHLSKRVSSAIEAEAVSAETGWALPRWGWGLAAVAGAIVVLLVVLPMRRTPSSDALADRSVATPAADTAPDSGEPADWAVGKTDDLWLVVAGLVEELDLESTSEAGIFVRPGSIEQALLMLSDEERRQLAHVIQAELDRSAS